MHPPAVGFRARIRALPVQLRCFGLPIDPLSQSVNRHPNAAPDPNTWKFAAGQEFVHLAATDADCFGRFDGTKKDSVHTAHFETRRTRAEVLQYPSSMPTFRHAPWDALRDADTLRLVRPMAISTLGRPRRVDLLNGVLGFTEAERPVRFQPPDTLLEQFLKIESSDAVLAFARRYGPLVISSVSGRVFRPRRVDWAEEVAQWQQYRRLFMRLLAAAANVRASGSPPLETLLGLLQDRETLTRREMRSDPWWKHEIDEWPKLDSRSRRTLVAGTVAGVALDLVNRADLRPALEPRSSGKGDPRFELVFSNSIANPSLFGALVIQVLAAIAGTGFAACSSCGAPYVPKRRPRSKGRHYCTDCGRPAALRDAKAAHRARLKARSKKGGEAANG
jgi:hypothetical protein